MPASRHYSLELAPFSYIAGYRMLAFLRRALSQCIVGAGLAPPVPGLQVTLLGPSFEGAAKGPAAA